jgi:hypothetical protein
LPANEDFIWLVCMANADTSDGRFVHQNALQRPLSILAIQDVDVGFGINPVFLMRFWSRATSGCTENPAQRNTADACDLVAGDY